MRKDAPPSAALGAFVALHQAMGTKIAALP